MNKVITDGLVLMPPSFGEGLDVWSSGDGTAGSASYAGAARYVADDLTFDGALELNKTATVTKLRYMGETTLLAGCYLQISTRVKCLSGPLPDVRIAGWAGQAGGSELQGVVTRGPTVSIENYGEVIELSVIVGTGPRTGVDMVWAGANYGHFGIDLLGPNGAVVRVDDIMIQDVTSVFVRDMLGSVDVRDFGATGDGTTDDAAAFAAANLAANGREVLVSPGTYLLGNPVVFDVPVRFAGRVIMGETDSLSCHRNFDFDTYLDAFGNGELALKKGLQAMFETDIHDRFNLCGARIALSAPLDLSDLLRAKTPTAMPRTLRNGTLCAVAGPAWDDAILTTTAICDPASAETLYNIQDVAPIKPGAQVTGDGVPRSLFVTAIDPDTKSLTLSAPLRDVTGTRPFTFTRHKFMLDFSGFDTLSGITLDDITLHCNDVASGLLLAPHGGQVRLKNCTIDGVKDNALASHGTGCDGLVLDTTALHTGAKTARGFNINTNGARVRNCQVTGFDTIGVLAGQGHSIAGNRFSNDVANSIGALVLTQANCASHVCGNHFDTALIEWSNDHATSPDTSFCNLTIADNIFRAQAVQPSFRWVVVAPHGQGHTITGLTVQGNTFAAPGCAVTRPEKIDTTHGTINLDHMRNITFAANTFDGVVKHSQNPHTAVHCQNKLDQSWRVDCGDALPFGGWAHTISALVPVQAIRNIAGQAVFAQPYVDPVNGAQPQEFRVIWPEATKGQMRYSARMDNPA